MTVNLKGQPFEFVVPGDRIHFFDIPLDRSQMHPKVAAAFGALEEARAAEQQVYTTKGNDQAAKAKAHEATQARLTDLYDVAAVNGKATREHAAERYDLAVRRYARAIEQAQAALQDAATAAQVWDTAANGAGIGINFKAKTRAVVTPTNLSTQISELFPMSAIDA